MRNIGFVRRLALLVCIDVFLLVEQRKNAIKNALSNIGEVGNRKFFNRKTDWKKFKVRNSTFPCSIE